MLTCRLVVIFTELTEEIKGLQPKSGGWLIKGMGTINHFRLLIRLPAHGFAVQKMLT